jgi:hypothetical protein
MRRPPRLRKQVCEGPSKRWAPFLFRSRSQREMAYPFFTIGHSTRTVSQFVDLFQASQIEFVVDVRHIPRSRTNPQFNRETLAEELATVQIGYAHVAALGGLRNRSRVDVSPNLFWVNLAFRAALGGGGPKRPRALESVPRHRFAIDHNQCCRLQGGMRSNKRRSAADVIKLSDLRDRQFFPRRRKEST